MCIYFIQAEQGGLIKIGYAHNVLKRLQGVQRMCPIKLRVLAIVENASDRDEKRLHKYLIEFRQYGEWFEPSEEVMRAINELGKPFDGPKAKPIVFTDEGTVIRSGYKVPRCQGYSKYHERRCKNAGQYEGFCIRHKP